MATDPQVQGFLSGGQLNKTETPGGGRAFSPTSPLDQPKLNVVAPLDVNAAPTQAMALAKALNVGWSIAEPKFEEMNVRRGRKDVAEGEAAATLGTVDEVKSAQIEGYRIGAARVATEQHVLAATLDADKMRANEWSQLPVADRTDPVTGAVTPGLLTTMDNFFRSRLGGLEKDPEAARVLAPMLQHYLNEAAGEQVAKQIKQTQNDAADTATALAMHSARAGDGSFKWDEQFQKMTQIFGGNKRAASHALVESIAQAAIQSKDPSIIDKYVPLSTTLPDGQVIAGPGQSAENSAVLQEAHQRATELQKTQWRLDRDKDFTGIQEQSLAGKNPRQALIAFGQQPGANGHEIEAAWNFWQSLNRQHEANQLDSGAVYKIQSDIGRGKISTPSQITDALNDTGITGKALSQSYSKLLDTLKGVQAANQDDPSVRAGAQEIDGTYKAVTGPAGNILVPAAAAQHTAAMADYHRLVLQYMQQNKSADEATTLATQDVKKKYGQSVNDPNGALRPSGALPKTDREQATTVRTHAADAHALLAGGVNADTLQHLYDSGQLSREDYEAATNTLLAFHTKR